MTKFQRQTVNKLRQQTANMRSQRTKNKWRYGQSWRSHEKMMSWKSTGNQPKMMSLKIMKQRTI